MKTIKDISPAVRNVLPISGQNMYLEAYNTSLVKHKDNAIASKIAWEVVKKHFIPSGNNFIAMSESFIPKKLYTFDLEVQDTLFVLNADDGTIRMDAVLADTNDNTDGKHFTEEDLNTLANQINKYGSTLPDVDHKMLDQLIDQYGGNPELVRNALTQQKGIFKTIKAVVEKGRLWIRAILDKRYKNHTSKYTGLSIEALADTTREGRLSNPIYLGFTFTNKPKLANALIV